MKTRFSTLLEDIPPSGIREFFDLVIGRDDIISLGVGEPDFITPWTIREDAIYSLEQGKTSYTSNQGLLELREEIARYLNKRFQVNYDPSEEIMITTGVSEGVDIILRAILNPGDEVLIPEPCYVCYEPLAQLTGAKVTYVPTGKNNFIIDPKEVEKRLTPKTKILLVCSPNNPTGTIIPKKELKQLSDLCKKHNVWLISDEIYAELSYDNDYTSLASFPNNKDTTILMSGFSKAFAMTGWRIGFICGPKDLIERALKIHQYCALSSPTIAQYAAIEALRKADDIVPPMINSYKQRRHLVVEAFNNMGLELPYPTGAFYCFPSIKSTGLSSKEFALQLLQEESVAVVPGPPFGPSGEGHIRCCYATNINQLKEALLRIKRFTTRIKERKKLSKKSVRT